MTDAQNTVRENEQADRVLRTTLAAMPQISLFFVDADLRYQAVLGGAAADQGYDVGAMIGRTVAEVLPGDAAARIIPMFERALGGEVFAEIVTGPSGARFETRFAPAVHGDQVVGAVAVVRDVSAERRAAEELAATDELHQLLMDNIGEVITVTTVAEARHLWVSPSAQRLTGWTSEELVGRSVVDLVPAHDLERFTEAWERLRAGADQVTVTHGLARPDGGVLHVEVEVRRIGEDRGPEAVVLTALRDVTERVELQAELERAQEVFALSFTAAPIGMALVDPEGRFIRVNDALCSLLGRGRAALLDLTFQDITHPEDLTADLGLLAEVENGERDGYRMEKRYVRPDGAVVWALLAVSVVRTGGRPRFFISQVEDITERKNALHELQRLTTTDHLTGLPNRLLLMDRMRHALVAARRDGALVGVIVVDLDQFKRINDTLGHDAGDELLRATARRLVGAVDEGDIVTRLGGDEFVVVSQRVESLEEVTRLARRIRQNLTRPYTVFGHEVTIDASIGVTAGNVMNGESLLREADQAMHAAKRNRGGVDRVGRVDVYAEAYEVLAHDRLALHAALHAGIPRGELVVHYQPIVDLHTGTPSGREALVRWHHPSLGLLRPGAFLDGTDHSRLGALVGEEVLRQACTSAAGWPDPLFLHVNISARHLADPRLPHLVDECLSATGLDADRLVLEITESLILTASPSTLSTTRAIAGMGVGLSLDDFGTGYSSITALHRLPIDSFKIDKSFVSGLPDDAASAPLVEGLIQLGTHLDLDAIAEGVETSEQATWLADRGCHHAQGFYFGHPEPLGVVDPDGQAYGSQAAGHSAVVPRIGRAELDWSRE